MGGVVAVYRWGMQTLGVSEPLTWAMMLSALPLQPGPPDPGPQLPETNSLLAIMSVIEPEWRGRVRTVGQPAIDNTPDMQGTWATLMQEACQLSLPARWDRVLDGDSTDTNQDA